MKKLKLNLEDLKVESFEISSNIHQKGTVYGNLPPGESIDANRCGGGGGTGGWSYGVCLSVTCPPSVNCTTTITEPYATCPTCGCNVSNDCTQPPQCQYPDTISCDIWYC